MQFHAAHSFTSAGLHCRVSGESKVLAYSHHLHKIKLFVFKKVVDVVVRETDALGKLGMTSF